ncbi:hypothetical protein F4X73_15110 [Candidatus Poribacteria bacterium]|nr:hypothetical protein [Candidatus Poribacteria bacterium]
MVLNPSLRLGILNAVPVSCHNLEAPELVESTEYNIPHPTVETTMQLPYGFSSALSELLSGEMCSIDFLLLCVFNYRSTYDTGKTWRTGLRLLSELTDVSVRYIRERLSDLKDKGWLFVLSVGINTGSIYEVVHHNCDRDEVPTDKNGNPLKFAIPRGVGGILERLFSGDISWKSAVVWIVMKYRSDWQTGITNSLSIDKIRKWVGMSPQTVVNCIKELTKAGLVKRLSKKHEAGVYQLYPKPDGKPKPVFRKRKVKKVRTPEDKEMRADGDWRYSFNELWRVNVETNQIQRRKSRRFGIWRNTSEHERYTQMPKSMRDAFEKAYEYYHQIKRELGVTDSTHSVTHTAQGVTHTAHDVLEREVGGNGSKGS